MVANLRDMIGEEVTAKRLGWDEELTAEQEMDLDPFDGDVPLRGELSVVESDSKFTGPLTVWLVDGKLADSKTVERI